ncbi:unnamed protein product [Nippostrongylus brasiliensis]|uniref:SMG6 nonsense mediated mRNA decay factor n=1 Tax=Nippostrongylus brasiliensis TaxID=27835 RepID=A0A0N4YRM3_NIPBR|nr:unnamed protein product [Nippostrongylus brasiliensis]
MAKRDRLQETTIPQQEAVVEIVDSKREVKRKTDTDRVTTTDSLIEQDIVKRTEVRNNQMKERITWTTRERIVETTDELVANAPGPRRSGQSLTWMGKRQEVNDKGLSSAPSRSDTPLTSKGNSQTTPDPNTLTGEKANSKHQDEKVHGQMKVPEAANERERSLKGKEEKDITRVDLPSRVHQASNRDSDKPLARNASQTISEPNSLLDQSVSARHKEVEDQMQKEGIRTYESEKSAKGERITKSQYDLPSGLKNASNADFDRSQGRNISRSDSEPNSLHEQSASRRHKDAKVERKKAVPRKVAESERRAKGERIAISQYDLPSGLKSASNTDFDGPLERDISGTNSEPNSLHEQGESRRHEDAKGPKQKEGPRKAPDRDRRTKGERITRAQYDLPPGLQSASNTEFDSPLAKDISETNSEPNSLLEQGVRRRHKGTEGQRRMEQQGKVPDSGRRAKGTRTTRKQIDLPPGLKNQPNTDRDEPFARDILRVNSEPNSLHEQSSSRNHKDAKVERKKEVPRKVAESERSAKVERITRTQYDLPPGLNNASSTDIDGPFARDISRTDTEPNSLREQSVGRKHKDAKVERKKEVPRKVSERERSAKVERITKTQHDLPPGLNNASSTDIDGPFARDISRTDTEPNSLRYWQKKNEKRAAQLDFKKDFECFEYGSVKRRHEKHSKPVELQKESDSESVDKKRKTKAFTNVLYGLPYGLICVSNWAIERTLERDNSGTRSEPNSLIGQSVGRRLKNGKDRKHQNQPRKAQENEGISKGKRTTTAFTNSQHDLPFGMKNTPERLHEKLLARDTSLSEPNSLLNQVGD